MLPLRSFNRHGSRTKLHHQRRIVTSANYPWRSISSTSRPAETEIPLQTTPLRPKIRLQQFSRDMSTSTAVKAEYKMSSDDARAHNNNDFQLGSVFDVRNKVALITGGGSGIGLMAVQALAVNGAKVYVCGRSEDKLETVSKTYSRDVSGQIIPITCDISKKDEIAALYDQIASKEQQLDILINNAGISTKTFQTEATSAEEMKKNLFDNDDATFQDWDDVYRTNVTQCWFMSMAFLPLLQKATEGQHGWSGTIINISSISGQVKTTQHHPQYNASKGATIHITRMLANEIQENGLKIRVNDIAPGVFPSEMAASDSGANQKSHVPKDKYADKVPAARPGHDRDMAGAVLFVATNQYLNGQTITVDGGYTLMAGR